MIYGLKQQETRDGREFYTFSTSAQIGNHQVLVGGWKYFPDTRRVYTPAVKYHNQWHPIVQDIPITLKIELSRLVACQLAADREESLVEQLKKDPDSVRREHPQQYREVFMAAYPETRPLFDVLPETRLWPDEVLKQRARKLVNRQLSLQEHEEDLWDGILLDADDDVVMDEFERLKRQEVQNVNC